MSGEDGDSMRRKAQIKRKSIAQEGDGSREALRLKQMRAKKERLEYAVERLALEARQRERQLRKSVAAQ